MSELRSFLWLRILHCMGGLCFICLSPTAGQWAVSTFQLLWVVLLWTFVYKYLSELARWLSGKESVCQWRRRRRCGFSPWVRKIPWRRTWPPTPVFWPGESHGQRSLVGYSPWSQRVRHDWATELNYSVSNCAVRYLLILLWTFLICIFSGILVDLYKKGKENRTHKSFHS